MDDLLSYCDNYYFSKDNRVVVYNFGVGGEGVGEVVEGVE